jgi:hypothetical protein
MRPAQHHLAGRPRRFADPEHRLDRPVRLATRALGDVVAGVALCLTIIEIPLGLANLKLIAVSLAPFGRGSCPPASAITRAG